MCEQECWHVSDNMYRTRHDGRGSALCQQRLDSRAGVYYLYGSICISSWPQWESFSACVASIGALIVASISINTTEISKSIIDRSVDRSVDQHQHDRDIKEYNRFKSSKLLTILNMLQRPYIIYIYVSFQCKFNDENMKRLALGRKHHDPFFLHFCPSSTRTHTCSNDGVAIYVLFICWLHINCIQMMHCMCISPNVLICWKEYLQGLVN